MRTLVLALGLLAAAAPAGAGEAAGPARPAKVAEPNPRIVEAPANRWLKLHAQKPGDAVRFALQEHGGSCFDRKRGRFVLFGSNTHGQDWKNSPLYFDVATCQWSRAYPDDARETYKLTEAGLPVAGKSGDHPWAMHTFGAVVYDPGRDEMVVASFCQHMKPGRFSDALAGLWEKVKKHPTWTFGFAGAKWRPLECSAIHFFPYAAAWDSHRKVVIGYGGPGIWELGGRPRVWKKIAGEAKLGWHNNCTYDAKEKALVVFGSNQNSNDVVVYRPATGEHVMMPTVGTRPPKDQHAPMCFDEAAGVTVVVVDRVLGDAKDPMAKRQAEVWLYDLARDEWTNLPGATFPFGCGLNYNMEYDPNHKACILVATAPAEGGGGGRAVTVFALKVDVKAQKEGE